MRNTTSHMVYVIPAIIFLGLIAVVGIAILNLCCFQN